MKSKRYFKKMMQFNCIIDQKITFLKVELAKCSKSDLKKLFRFLPVLMWINFRNLFNQSDSYKYSLNYLIETRYSPLRYSFYRWYLQDHFWPSQYSNKKVIFQVPISLLQSKVDAIFKKPQFWVIRFELKKVKLFFRIKFIKQK